MIPYPLRKFVSDLINATNQGKIKWHAGEWPAFFCNHKDLTIHVWHRIQEYSETNFIAMRIDSQTDSPAIFEVSQFEEDDYITMNALWHSASINASNLIRKIDHFFD